MINITYYYSDKCKPCHKIKPIIDDYRKKYNPNVEIQSICVDSNIDVAIQQKITGSSADSSV